MKIKVLYEDNHLLVVEKPINIPVQQDASNDEDLLNILKLDIKERYQKPGNVYLALVHRLDRPVGGAIVFAKTSKAASRLANSLRKQELNRVYYTIVRGIVKENSARLTHYLFKDRRKNQVSAVHQNTAGAKKATLDYQVIQHFQKEELSLLQVTLQTGRSHQIRVQLKELGHPIYGDQRYGANVNTVGQQIALWSYELSFNHPVKDEIITVNSQPPKKYPWNLL